MGDVAERGARLRVALDAAPLLGPLSGASVAFIHLAEGLAADERLACSVFAKGMAANDLEMRLPKGISHRQRRLPPRLFEWTWRSLGWPPVDGRIGHPAVVHSFGDLVAPVRSARHLITIHDAAAVLAPEVATPRAHASWASIERAVRRGAHLHVATHALAASLSTHFGIPHERIHVIPFGVPPLLSREPVERGAVVPATMERYICALGVEGARKGISTLVRAFDQLADDDPGLGLVLMGRSVQARPPTRHADRVIWTGPCSAAMVRAILTDAQVLAFPSLHEGFGFPPLQAMALRVPVVASDLAPLREVLGDAALFAAPGDVAGLAHGLDAVMGNEALRRDLTIRGRAKVERYDWTETARAFADLYCSLAA